MSFKIPITNPQVQGAIKDISATPRIANINRVTRNRENKKNGKNVEDRCSVQHEDDREILQN